MYFLNILIYKEFFKNNEKIIRQLLTIRDEVPK